MSSEPSISVVVPTHQHAPTVLQAIDSVLAQGAGGFEVIVVDDGSTDGTAELLASITDPRVRVVTQENRGVAAARNAGVAVAEHSFVTFLDSDDVALPGWLGFFREARSNGADLASCALEAVDPDGSCEIVTPREPDAAFGWLRARFLAGGFAIDRSLLADAGGFREGLTHSEHTDLALRLGGVANDRRVDVIATDEPLVRIQRDDATVDPQTRFDSAMTILEEDRHHLERSDHLLATYLAIAGVNASKLGRRREAVNLLSQAVRVRPQVLRNWARLARALVAGRS